MAVPLTGLADPLAPADADALAPPVDPLGAPPAGVGLDPLEQAPNAIAVTANVTSHARRMLSPPARNTHDEPAVDDPAGRSHRGGILGQSTI